MTSDDSDHEVRSRSRSRRYKRRYRHESSSETDRRSRRREGRSHEKSKRSRRSTRSNSSRARPEMPRISFRTTSLKAGHDDAETSHQVTDQSNPRNMASQPPEVPKVPKLVAQASVVQAVESPGQVQQDRDTIAAASQLRDETKMAVEGVMVSYNYSEDGELANILTVAASGIKFSHRWVLTHGSILSPLKQVHAIKNAKGKPILNEEFYDNLPEIHVTCEKGVSKTPNLYEGVERLSRERSLDNDADLEHSSYQIRILTGRICHVWQCPILDRCVDDILYSWTIGHRDGDVEKQTQLGKALLSVFVLVDLESDDRGLKALRPLSELFDMVRPPPGRGSTVEVHSTPFGCEVFLNAVTRGSVCGVVGKRPSLLLTDAATALGSEGGPVFTEGPTKELIGTVVCSVSWWRGEWVGLTLMAPLVSVLAAKLRVAPPRVQRPLSTGPHRDILDRIDKTTVLVRCGTAWGTGLYLGGGYVVTCAHVVKHYSTYKISLYCQGVKETAIVRYKTADDKAYDLALLYTNPQYWNQLTPAVFAHDPAEKGESVLAAGYPYFNEINLEELKPTVTTGHINNASPSMIQTSCCVQSGFSGGPIFRLTQSGSRVEVLGIIVSNAKTETGACYPYINMAVPTKAFIHLLQNFINDKDETKLRAIENDKEMIQSQWRLMPYRSKI